MSKNLTTEEIILLIKTLKKRKATFEKWNEELKGNYVDRIFGLDRRIKELEIMLEGK